VSTDPEVDPRFHSTPRGWVPLNARVNAEMKAVVERRRASTGTRSGEPTVLDEADKAIDEAIGEFGSFIASERDRQSGAISSWRPIDLRPVLAGEYRGERPEVCTRSDGPCLFYLKRLHWVSSEPGAGKTFLILCAVAEAIEAGFTAVYVDCDHNGMEAIVDRLRRMGCRDEAIQEHLRYVAPDDPLRGEHLEVFRQTVGGAVVVVVDNTTNAMVLEGFDPNSPVDFAKWARGLLAVARASGAAVVASDHVTKSREARGRWPIGAGTKLAEVDGAAYLLEARQPIAPGRVGRSTIICTKDRHGAVIQSTSDGRTMGELVVDATDDFKICIEPSAPPRDDDGLSPAQRFVLEALPHDQAGAIGHVAIGEALKDVGHPLKKQTITEACRGLISRGLADDAVMDRRGTKVWWATD
jgi:hypothetical protein